MMQKGGENNPASQSGMSAAGPQPDGKPLHETPFSAVAPELQEASSAARAKDYALAERLVRGYLDRHSTDVNGLRLLAELTLRKGDHRSAESFFSRCLDLAPDYAEARHRYATFLVNVGKLTQAKRQIEILLQTDPHNVSYRSLMAYVLGQVGDYSPALRYHEGILAETPNEYLAWLVYANDLRAAGRQQDCIAAYRRVINLNPEAADAYWNLSNLKTFRFSTDEIDSIQEKLKRADLPPRNRIVLHFCLGKTFEDGGLYEEAFAHFKKANALQRSIVTYDADRTTSEFASLSRVFTREFFEKRSLVGCEAPDPIFIVGLPRSGSTLVEQILSSHSAIEGTRELPNVQAIAANLEGGFPGGLFDLDPQAFEAMGLEYLGGTQVFRRLGRPHFIDKMPSNFIFSGFIHLLFPKSKIIDVRRDPLDCCLANFKQLFARAFTFSYSLTDLGRYYRDYQQLMAHYDTVLPGRIHRIVYEDLVADPEAEIRRLLRYLGLPFEAGCLRYYENDRAIRTASSEQVRMPIFTESIGSWRRYKSHLIPLIGALGSK